jgi:hypothetical protein
MIVAASVAVRQIGQQRRQEQGGDGKSDGGKGAGRRRFRACVEVHHRAREAAGDRIAAGEGRADIGGAQADQLLVGVDALAFLGRERLGDRDGFHEADDRDQQCGADQAAEPQVGSNGGMVSGGRPAARPDGRTPWSAEVEDPAIRVVTTPPPPGRPWQKSASLGFMPVEQERFQSLAHPEQEGRAATPMPSVIQVRSPRCARATRGSRSRLRPDASKRRGCA